MSKRTFDAMFDEPGFMKAKRRNLMAEAPIKQSRFHPPEYLRPRSPIAESTESTPGGLEGAARARVVVAPIDISNLSMTRTEQLTDYSSENDGDLEREHALRLKYYSLI